MENVITVAAVERVYRRILAGESLNDIETSDQMKHLIREFTKWSSLPGSQITRNSDVPLDVALALRALNKHFKTKQTRANTSGIIRSADVTFAVKRLLRGDSTSLIKSCGICDEAIRIAGKCIRVLEAGGGTRELYKLGISHPEAVNLIKFIESHQQLLKQAITNYSPEPCACD